VRVPRAAERRLRFGRNAPWRHDLVVVREVEVVIHGKRPEVDVVVDPVRSDALAVGEKEEEEHEERGHQGPGARIALHRDAQAVLITEKTRWRLFTPRF